MRVGCGMRLQVMMPFMLETGGGAWQRLGCVMRWQVVLETCSSALDPKQPF